MHEEKLEIIDAFYQQLKPLNVILGNGSGRAGPDFGVISKEGVPVASFKQDGRDYFDLHHTPNDTFDKIDRMKLRENIAVYAAYIYLVAEMKADFR